MSDLPRFREPMCGWPADLDVCRCEIPRYACLSGHADDDGDFRPSDAKYDDA